MEEYYKLRNQYEKKISSKIKKIYNDDKLTLDEKRSAAKKFVPQCIKCKRRVKTLFIRENNNYLIKCGNAENPCELNVSIQTKQYSLIQDIIDTLEKDAENARESIIKTKLNFLFKYVSEEDTLGIFETRKREINIINEYIHKLKQELTERLDENERNLKISRYNSTYQEHVKLLNENSNEFKKTGNIQYLNDNALLVKDSILPLLASLREAKYDISGVVSKEIDNELHYHVYNVKNKYSKTEKDINNE